MSSIERTGMRAVLKCLILCALRATKVSLAQMAPSDVQKSSSAVLKPMPMRAWLVALQHIHGNLSEWTLRDLVSVLQCRENSHIKLPTLESLAKHEADEAWQQAFDAAVAGYGGGTETPSQMLQQYASLLSGMLCGGGSTGGDACGQAGVSFCWARCLHLVVPLT